MVHTRWSFVILATITITLGACGANAAWSLKDAVPPVPGPADDFRTRVEAAGVSNTDMDQLLKLAVVVQNRMEASVALAYNKDKCVPLALKEVLLRLIRIRLAMPDVKEGRTTWRDALGQLFQLPGSPGDGTKDSKGKPMWFLDMHGPVTIKPGVIAPGRSGTFLGDVERVNDTPDKKQKALRASIKDVLEVLENMNLREMMHLAARAQEAGEKMEHTDNPAYVGTLRWILEQVEPKSSRGGITAMFANLKNKNNDANKEEDKAAAILKVIEPLGFNYEHLKHEKEFQDYLHHASTKLKLSYGLLLDSEGWRLFKGYLPDAYNPQLTLLEAVDKAEADAKAKLAKDPKSCHRCLEDLETIREHVKKNNNAVQEDELKFERDLPKDLIGLSGEELLSYRFKGRDAKEITAQMQEAFKATHSTITEGQGAPLLRKKGLLQALPPSEVNDRAGDATSTFRGAPDFKLAGAHWSALVDSVGERMGLPPLTAKEKMYLTKYEITKLPGFGVGGYVWPRLSVNVVNSRFLMNLRMRLLGATAGPSGTTDELMQLGDYVGVTRDAWMSFCLRGAPIVSMDLVDHHSWDEIMEGAESPDRTFGKCPPELYIKRKRPEYVTWGKQCSWDPDDPFDKQTLEPSEVPKTLLSISASDDDKTPTFIDEPLKWNPFDLRKEAESNFDTLSKGEANSPLERDVLESDFPNKYTPNKKHLDRSDEPPSTAQLEAVIKKAVCDNPKFEKSWGWRYEFCGGRQKYAGQGTTESFTQKVDAVLDDKKTLLQQNAGGKKKK